MRLLVLTLFVFFFSTSAINAQTTIFTYQGRLSDTTLAASGEYDFQFSLYDDNGTQIGSTITRSDVTVSNGVFTVQLNFNAATAFNGGSRLLEIAVRRGAETGAYTTLTPRQPLTSAPYSIRALNATNADNATYAASAGQAMTAATAATATTAADAQNSQQLGGTPANQFVQTDSTLFIRNRTTQQTSTNFNIDGIGGASIFAAGTQFNIGNSRILSNAGTDNLFVGVGAGAGNTLGENNSFVGFNAGGGTTQGVGNSFFGRHAGFSNTTGSNNTAVGQNANVGSGTLTFATALGAGAIVNSNNTLVLGRSLDTVQIPGDLNIAGTFTANFTVPTSNITGVLSPAKGGTGLTSAGAAGNILRSDGTNFTSAPLQPSDFPAGSQNYLQNTNTQQAGVNFNVGGSGTIGGLLSANIVNTTAQFNIGGVRVLSNAGTDNLFAAVNSGSTGTANAFFGAYAGNANSIGGVNAFFGTRAGELNTTGDGNSFFGLRAGNTNTTGDHNTIVGYDADVNVNNLVYASAFGAGAIVSTSNTVVLGRAADEVQVPGTLDVTGAVNAATQYNLNDKRIIANNGFVTNFFAGVEAGESADGTYNSFFGYRAGRFTSGTDNSFFGTTAGRATSTGSGNSFFGSTTGELNTLGEHNSFFGAFAGSVNTTGNDNSVFGFQAGKAITSGDGNAIFGNSAGYNLTYGNNNSFFGTGAGISNTTGLYNVFIGANTGASNFTGNYNTAVGNNANISGNLTFATAIGAGALASKSSTVVLGRSSDTVIAPNKLEVGTLGSPGSTSLCRNPFDEISTCTPGNFTEADGANLLEAVKKQAAQIEAQQRQIEELKTIVCSIKADAAVCLKKGDR